VPLSQGPARILIFLLSLLYLFLPDALAMAVLGGLCDGKPHWFLSYDALNYCFCQAAPKLWNLKIWRTLSLRQKDH
jgi:hypothetical protein